MPSSRRSRHEGGGDDRADTWDIFQPPARLARAMPGQDALPDGSDLGSDGAVLPRQHIENTAGSWGNPVIHYVRDDTKQLAGSIAALRRHDTEFGQVTAYGIA